MSVAPPASRLALLNAPLDAPVRLRGMVLQEQRIHRFLQTDVKLVGFALGERDDENPREVKVLSQARTSAWKRLTRSRVSATTDSIKPPPRVLVRCLHAEALDHSAARDGEVLVRAGNRPVFARGAHAVDPELVLVGGHLLLAGRMAGKECCANGNDTRSPITRRPPGRAVVFGSVQPVEVLAREMCAQAAGRASSSPCSSLPPGEEPVS